MGQREEADIESNGIAKEAGSAPAPNRGRGSADLTMPEYGRKSKWE